MQETTEYSRNLCDFQQEDRFRLISLGEMMEAFKARVLVRFGVLSGLHVFRGDVAVSAFIRRPLLESLPLSQEDCVHFNLPLTRNTLARIERSLGQSSYTQNALSADLIDFDRRLREELETRFFLRLSLEQAMFYEEPTTGWNTALASFPSARFDVEEAAKSFALNRYTACVFHLMRVMELSLRVLAKTLHDPKLNPKRNPSWNSILGKCSDELKKPLASRSPEWQTDDVFYSGVATRLMGVKDAWRNPTMHVEQIYTEETALDVWNHVKSFMNHIANKLSE